MNLFGSNKRTVVPTNDDTHDSADIDEIPQSEEEQKLLPQENIQPEEKPQPNTKQVNKTPVQKTNIIAVSHQNRIGQFLKLHCTNNTLDQAQNNKIRFLNGAVVKIEFDNDKNATITLLYAGNDNSVKKEPYYQTDKVVTSKSENNLKYDPVPFNYTLLNSTTYGKQNTVIYLVRHGEAWHNANTGRKGLVADTLLTKAGCEQTEGSAQAIFDDLDVYQQSKIDYYASSDLNRARETMYKIQAKIYLLNRKPTKSGKFAGSDEIVGLSLPTKILIVPCLHERVVKDKLKDSTPVLVSTGGRENYLKPRIIGKKLGLGSIESDTTSKTNCDKKQSPYYFRTPETQLNKINYNATYYHTFYDGVGSYNQRYNTFVVPGYTNTISEIEQRCETSKINILRMILNTIEEDEMSASLNTIEMSASSNTNASTDNPTTNQKVADTKMQQDADNAVMPRQEAEAAEVELKRREDEEEAKAAAVELKRQAADTAANAAAAATAAATTTSFDDFVNNIKKYILDIDQETYNKLLRKMNKLNDNRKAIISKRINDYIDENYTFNAQKSKTNPEIIRLNNILYELNPIITNDYYNGGKKSRRNKKIRRNKSKKLRKSHKINYTFISSNTGNRISNLKRNFTKHRKQT